MRIKHLAAIAAFAFLAGPALAQEADPAPAPVDNTAATDQSTAQTVDDVDSASNAFPDSTRIPEPPDGNTIPADASDNPH
jgi:predicted outer membrane protein